MLENQNINFWFLLFFRGKVEIKVIIKIRKSGLKGSIMFSGRQKLKRNFVLPYTTRANIYISISPVLPINSQKIATRSVGEQSRPSGNGGGGVFSVSDALSPGLIQQQQAKLTCLVFQRVERWWLPHPSVVSTAFTKPWWVLKWHREGADWICPCLC